jgi:type 1 glutamine amidotransferase
MKRDAMIRLVCLAALAAGAASGSAFVVGCQEQAAQPEKPPAAPSPPEAKPPAEKSPAEKPPAETSWPASRLYWAVRIEDGAIIVDLEDGTEAVVRPRRDALERYGVKDIEGYPSLLARKLRARGYGDQGNCLGKGDMGQTVIGLRFEFSVRLSDIATSELRKRQTASAPAAPLLASADADAPATATASAAEKSAAPPSAESRPQEAPRGTPDFKLKPGKAEPGRTTRILIVTGQEHPAHQWQQTAPVLAEELSKDPRLLVDVSEDAGILASSQVADYAAIVLHFMNTKPFDLGAKGRENLRRYVEGGKGLMLVHFACGAFQEWPEFRDLVARVWDPKRRGHDPRGPFRVEITAADHPITRGLKAFDADDELYTCLTGDKPIEVLATAKSKVDGKDYPMAFVYAPGKGRVFQCLLGHDVKAMQMPGVGELYRRGCAWAAGLPPAVQGR